MVNENRITVLLSLVLAILFVGCVIVQDSPQFSFTLFACITSLGVFKSLKKKNLFVNEKAKMWLIPIFLIAIMNTIFSQNLFTALNILVFAALMAVFTLQALSTKDPWNFEFVEKIVFTGAGNWYVFASKIANILSGDSKENSKKIAKVLIGIVICIPFLVIISTLLMSADQVFKAYAKNLISFELLDEDVIVRIVMGCLAFVYFAGYVHQAKKFADKQLVNIADSFKIDSIISSTFLILLNLVFLSFSFVQFAFLFTGGFMQLPDGLVYSSYAREGFFQLLTVTIINFAVICFFLSAQNKNEPHKVLKVLLLLLCLFTAILVASSFYRMYLYMSAYGFTFLRMIVVTFLGMEVVLLTGSVRYLLGKKFNLFKFFVVCGLAAYIIVNITASPHVSEQLNNIFGFESELRREVVIHTWQGFSIFR